MGIYKAENGTWFVSCSYEDWTGKKSRKVKRGFKTKKEANEWESNFMVKNSRTACEKASCSAFFYTLPTRSE